IDQCREVAAPYGATETQPAPRTLADGIMNDFREDERLTRLLDELGSAEPPAGFADQVMTRIVSGERPFGRLRFFNRGGIVMAKKVMLGLAAAAVVVFAVFIVRGGFPTVDRGTEGTIGAAKKSP